MVHEYPEIRERLDALGPATAEKPVELTIQLGKSDASWNSASTKNLVYGPATVTYREWVDGGIDTIVAEAVTA